MSGTSNIFNFNFQEAGKKGQAGEGAKEEPAEKVEKPVEGSDVEAEVEEGEGKKKKKKKGEKEDEKKGLYNIFT